MRPYRFRLFVRAMCAWMLAASGAAAAAQGPQPPDRREEQPPEVLPVKQLLRQLAEGDPENRELARARLVAAAEAIRTGLDEALKSSDAEVRLRARQIIGSKPLFWAVALPHDRDAASQALLAKLAEPAPEIRFDGIELEYVVPFCADFWGVNIHANWAALQRAGVPRDTEVSCKLKELPGETVLTLLLEEAGRGATPIHYAVRQGVLVISTSLPSDDTPVPHDTDAASRQVLQKVRQPVPQLRFDEIGVEQVLAFLSDLQGVKVTADWPRLAEACVSAESSVTLRLKNVSLEVGLGRILDDLSTPQHRLAFAVRGGKVVVSTREALLAGAAPLAPVRSTQPAAPGPVPAAPDVGKLVEQLSAPCYEVRESATDRLARLSFLANGDVLAGLKSSRPAAAADLLNRWFTTIDNLYQPERDPANKELLRRMKQNVPEIRFENVGLENVIDFLRDLQGVNIHVRWHALAAQGIERETGVTVTMTDTQFQDALAAILWHVSKRPPGVEFRVWQGVLVVTAR